MEISCINSVENLNRPPWKLPGLEVDFSNVSSVEDLIHSDEGLMLEIAGPLTFANSMSTTNFSCA